MEEQAQNKWIICRICLKTSENEMHPIFGTDTFAAGLADEIADYGLITVSESKKCPDRICNKCMLLLKAARKFRQLCQRSAKQWQNLLQLSEREPINSDKTDIMGILNKIDYTEQMTDATQLGKSLVLNKDRQDEEGDNVDSFVFEVIEDVDEDCNDGDDHIQQSSGGEFIELDNDRMDFLEDNSTENSDELTYSNSQFEVLKHEEILSSEGHINKFFYDDQHIEKPTKEQQKITDREECEFEMSTKIVSVKAHITRGRKKLTDIQKNTPKTKPKDVGDYPTELPKRATTNYICSYCGNVYNEKSKLTLHLRIHTKEKPHECEICRKRFAQTPQLTRHMNSHTGNRPFKCKFCEASFADPSTCIKHQRIHTQERPYVCETCGKAFSYSNVLKVHVMSHTGEKPYNCKYCGKKFTQSHHRRTHERIHI